MGKGRWIGWNKQTERMIDDIIITEIKEPVSKYIVLVE